MKSELFLSIALAFALPGVAAAGDFDTPSPPLPDLLAKAREAKKPLLLEFSAVWCVPCKHLAAELAKPENQTLLERFVFHTYDAERGEGTVVAAKYGVIGYPTLIVVDDKGAMMVKQIGLDSSKVSAWLKVQADATRSESELEAIAKANPADVDVLWLLAKRAQSKNDLAAARARLAQIEAADKTTEHRDAADAGWQRVELELRDRFEKEVRAQMSGYLDKYPADGEPALRMLVAAGADEKTTSGALTKLIDASSEEYTLNSLVYTSLSVGALDAALLAAEKMVKVAPDDPNAYDCLAEVYNYRGDRDQALATEKKGLAMPKVDGEMASVMRANLKRFETGGPSADVKPAPKLPSLVSPAPSSPRDGAMTPETAARVLYSKKAFEIGGKCAPKAKRLEEAYVRISFGPGKVERVEVLEPAASPALRKCLDGAVRAVELPAEQKPTRIVLPIKLA